MLLRPLAGGEGGRTHVPMSQTLRSRRRLDDAAAAVAARDALCAVFLTRTCRREPLPASP